MTPRQAILAKGFKPLGYARQTSYKYDYYGILRDGKVVALAGIEVKTWERNPASVMVDVAGKRRYIYADYQDAGSPYKRFDDAQIAKLNALLDESVAAGPAPEKPKKPRLPSPRKGTTLSDEEKADNRVWRHLGYLTCVGFVDKYMQQNIDYVRGPKFIRVEDRDCVMAYANIREDDLKEINLTLADLEKFLVSRGVKRKAQKRVKRSYSLYD